MWFSWVIQCCGIELRRSWLKVGWTWWLATSRSPYFYGHLETKVGMGVRVNYWNCSKNDLNVYTFVNDLPLQMPSAVCWTCRRSMQRRSTSWRRRGTCWWCSTRSTRTTSRRWGRHSNSSLFLYILLTSSHQESQNVKNNSYYTLFLLEYFHAKNSKISIFQNLYWKLINRKILLNIDIVCIHENTTWTFSYRCYLTF